MLYNILTIADIHWGAMSAETTYKVLKQFQEFIEEFQDVDMVVILGDYFDAKIQLSSQAAILSIQWMSELVETCKKNNVKKIRIVKGTEDHDNNQLEAFRGYEAEDGYFKIFTRNTVEETLPGMNCIYCPDENINEKDYVEMYLDNMMSGIDVMFFHGSFDVVLPEITIQLSEEQNKNSIIYRYDTWAKLVAGCMIGGHWHDGTVEEAMIYVGSMDRWAFGEDEVKGFGFLAFDTETKEYYYKKIPNRYAIPYHTYEIPTHIFTTIEQYNEVIRAAEELLEKFDNDIRIRIRITITDDNPNNDTFISSVKNYFINTKNVKVVVKNKFRNNRKKEVEKRNKEITDKYDFIFDKSLDKPEIIHNFIKTVRNKDIPVEFIKKYWDKYSK